MVIRLSFRAMWPCEINCLAWYGDFAKPRFQTRVCNLLSSTFSTVRESTSSSVGWSLCTSPSFPKCVSNLGSSLPRTSVEAASRCLACFLKFESRVCARHNSFLLRKPYVPRRKSSWDSWSLRHGFLGGVYLFLDFFGSPNSLLLRLFSRRLCSLSCLQRGFLYTHCTALSARSPGSLPPDFQS